MSKMERKIKRQKFMRARKVMDKTVRRAAREEALTKKAANRAATRQASQGHYSAFAVEFAQANHRAQYAEPTL